jgi:branched-chain amino acid aminotransferase
MSKKNNLIWFRGKIIDECDAFVNVLSPTAQFGLNVFEGIRCYWNDETGELYAFRLKEHLDRLMLSSRLLRLTSPYTIIEIEGFMKSAIQANDFQTDAAVRITIFGDGQGTWNSCEPVSMFVAPMAKSRMRLDKVPALRACISSWERINDNTLPPRAKVGANYINGRYAHLQARHDGYDLPIFLGQDGKVSEGAGACLFMVRNGYLVTPTTTSSVLESITRDTLIVLAREAGLTVVERPVDRTELYLADEVFLCGSAAEISPIVSVDGYVLGDSLPGPITVSLLKAYLAVASGENLDHLEWRTVVHSRT